MLFQTCTVALSVSVFSLICIAAPLFFFYQDVVKRIQSLELSGLISGVIDDRGKYIYISAEEMENVAMFIEKRGRVSIQDVVAQSNVLINLKGNEISKEKKEAAGASEAKKGEAEAAAEAVRA